MSSIMEGLTTIVSSHSDHSLQNSNLSALRSTTITFAPINLEKRATPKPIGPAPTTNTVSPD